MADKSHDYYRILGLTKNARPDEVKRAYDKRRAKMREEATPPDPRLVVLLQEAHDTLSDPARREAYDASLRARPSAGPNRRGWAVAAAVFLVVALGIVLLVFRGRDDSPPPLTDTEILSAASLAVGRVHSIDLGGQAAALGLAFAVGQGRLLMACATLPATSEIVVRIGARDVPARIAGGSAREGYCALDAPQAGSWPLALGTSIAQGDTIRTTRVSDAGEVTLVEGEVRGIERRAGGAVLELSGDAAREERGGPVLDSRGRVVAISQGEGRFAALPPNAGSSEPAARQTTGR